MTTRAMRNRNCGLARWLAGAGLCCIWLALAPAPSRAEPAPAAAPEKNASQLLKEQQSQVVARYKRFEEVLLRMAEVTASDDPQRAALLRQAVARSKKQLIALQYERLMQAMDGERYSVAVSTQADVTRDLKQLLELLLNEDRSKRLASEQERVREYIKQLNKLIKEQQGLEAQTRRGQQGEEQLADRQGNLADNTGKLGEQVKRDADEARRELGGDADDEDRDSDSQGKDGEQSGAEDSEVAEASAEQGDAESDPPSGGKSDKAQSGKSQSGEKQSGEQDAGEQQDGEQQSGESQESGEPSDSQQQESQQADGKPSDGKPSDQSQQQGQQSGESGESGEQQDEASDESQDRPTDSVQQRLKAAQQRMQQATERLKQAQRNEAADQQRKALEELEQAKAELEKILRQLREEELARVLAMLEARFRKMLAVQKEVYSATTRLVALPDDQRGRSVEIESGRLGRQESQIALEADKALTLLREDGSAVAMPEAVVQLRDDMQQVSQRLNEFKLDALTVGLEEDIIAGLEDILAALEKAKKDLEQQQQQQSPPPSGEPQEPPLVDALAELKMIRALQMRVNRRTQTYSELIDGEQAVQADLLAALEELAQRQERIYRATKDIAIGRNR